MVLDRGRGRYIVENVESDASEIGRDRDYVRSRLR
jgi:hypothetical protein